MVHTRRACIAHHLRGRRFKVLGVVDLVDQTKPFASFHSCFERVQHALCPHRLFHPIPACWGCGFCNLFSRTRHCRRLHRSLHGTSTFLDPFAPRPLWRFSATMGPLTPTDISRVGRSPRLTFITFRPFCLHPRPCPPSAFTATLSRWGRRASLHGSRLRLSLAGSPNHGRRNEFLSYGPVVRFRMLSTSLRNDAVSFSYTTLCSGRGEDFHLSDDKRSRAH